MPTQKTIAEHLFLSQSEVSRHMAELGVDWQTASLDEIRVAYIRKVRAVAAGHKSHDGLDLTRERVLTEQVERELKQYELAERKGQLVNVDQLEAELVQMFMAFKTELIARDDKLKIELDALYGINIDAQVLEEHTCAVLQQLARYDPMEPSPTPVGSTGACDAVPDDETSNPENPDHQP